MIKRSEFLPKFNMLTAEQRASLAKSMLEFQVEVLPQIENAPEPWTPDTCSMFDQGLLLISTLFKARDFCIAAYAYRTANKRMTGFRTLFAQLQETLIKSGDIEESAADSITSNIQKKRFNTDPRNILKHAQLAAKVAEAERFPLGNLQRSAEGEPTIAVPVGVSSVSADDRPKHLDQYLPVLSPEMQKEASRIPDLYLQFADESYKLEQLCDNPKSSKQDRAYHANHLCEIEDRIKNLWRRIDLDYAKQTGKEISTEYQEFLDAETRQMYNDVKERALGEYSKLEIEMMTADNPVKEQARRARIERDKKFLRRDDRQQSDDHKANLLLAAKELHEWGYLITPSQVENCKSYGVDIPQEWTELSDEERKVKDAEREAKRIASEQKRNEKRKAQRKAAREAREAQEAADLAEAVAPYEQMSEGIGLM